MKAAPEVWAFHCKSHGTINAARTRWDGNGSYQWWCVECKQWLDTVRVYKVSGAGG